jgi:hypothetical protein
MNACQASSVPATARERRLTLRSSQLRIGGVSRVNGHRASKIANTLFEPTCENPRGSTIKLDCRI